MNLDLNCPNCGSENTQNIKVVHMSGTSTAIGREIVSDISDIRVTTKQTGLATKFPPPSKKPVGMLVFVFSIFGLFIAAMIGLVNWSMSTFWAIWILSTLASLIFVIPNDEYNKTKYVELYDNWAKQYFCNKCGNLFTPRTINNSGV